MFEYDRIAVSDGIGFKKTIVFVFVFFVSPLFAITVTFSR